MPNSWRKVTRLTAAEEQAFAKEHSAVFTETKDLLDDWKLGWQDGRKYEHYSIYKQQVGKDTFYRVLWTDNAKPDFLSPDISFEQILLYQGLEVSSAPYYSTAATQNGDLGAFGSVDIIPGKEKAKGILKTRVIMSITRDKTNKNKWIKDGYLKGQLYGSVEGWYYLMEEAIKKATEKDYSEIEIKASGCLVDPNIPLRYGLQNAFDGDPATSYVENTEDDLMGISVRVHFFGVRKIAIINGYAQNISLYKDNNRIKKLSMYYNANEIRDMELADNALGWQFIKVVEGSGGFSVHEVYRGEKYNDTCIAEFNLYLEKYGWLFGDIDE